MCVLVSTSVNKLPEDITRRFGVCVAGGWGVGGLIAAVMTVMAINTLSICQETMAEGDKDGDVQH